MNKKQEQQILDYYSTADKYIRSKTHSNAHQNVFTKENDKYQWIVLEQKIYSKNFLTAKEVFFLLRIAKPILRYAGTSNSFMIMRYGIRCKIS